MDLTHVGMLIAKNVALVVLIWNVALVIIELARVHAIACNRGSNPEVIFTAKLVQICICALFLYN